MFILIPRVIVMTCTYKIKDISTNSSLMDDLRPKNKLYQDLKLTEKYFGGVLPFEVLIKTNERKNNEDTSSKKLLIILFIFILINVTESYFFSPKDF